MKEKLLVALKTKYKTFGFGDKAFDGVADYLSKTVTEESAIETAISGVEGLLKAFQGDIDTVRNEKSGLQKQLDELKAKGTENKDDPTKQDPPKEKTDIEKTIEAAFASYSEKVITPLVDSIKGIQGEKLQTSRYDQLKGKLDDAPAPYRDKILKDFKRLSFKDDNDFNEYLEETATDKEAAKQDFANNVFKETVPPSSGSENVKESELIAGMINTGTKQIVEQQKQN